MAKDKQSCKGTAVTYFGTEFPFSIISRTEDMTTSVFSNSHALSSAIVLLSTGDCTFLVGESDHCTFFLISGAGRRDFSSALQIDYLRSASINLSSPGAAMYSKARDLNLSNSEISVHGQRRKRLLYVSYASSSF